MSEAADAACAYAKAEGYTLPDGNGLMNVEHELYTGSEKKLYIPIHSKWTGEKWLILKATNYGTHYRGEAWIE